MSRSIDRYWCRRLGVSRADLVNPGVHVVENTGSGTDGFRGVFFLSRDLTLIVSAPPDLVEPLKASASSLSAESIVQPDALRRAVGPEAGLAIGPAYQGFMGPGRSVATEAGELIRESVLDETDTEGLRDAAGDADWQASGISKVTGRVATAVEGSRVVGIAGLRWREEGVADPCVLVQPDRRGRGLATALVGRVVDWALEEDALVLYQTLHENAPAVRVAERLGFEEFATTVAVRRAEAE